MDPFDEFEFKPLTEGLGFHKKKVDLKKEVKESKTFDEPLSMYIPEAPPSELGTTARTQEKRVVIEPQFASPRTTIEDTVANRQTEAQQEVEKILADFKNSRAKAHADSTIQAAEIIDKKPRTFRWKLATPSILAFLMDIVAVAALNILGLIILLLVTEVDLMANILTGDIMLFASLGTMAIGIYWVYMTASRAFTGHSLGEWAFEYRTGTDEERKTKTYTLRVAWRGFLVLLTGGILLPLLSYIFGRDIAGDLSGVHLMRRSLDGAGS